MDKLNIKVSVITPTADQPTGMALAERYMRRQTMQPYEWIVSDDGIRHAQLTMGQTHIKRKRVDEGGASLASNVLSALNLVTGDVVLIWEHDDWYSKDHISNMIQRLANHKAAGSISQRYYNVRTRQWVTFRNYGSSLCNTAFTADLIPKMQTAAMRCRAERSYCLDRYFWDSIPDSLKNIDDSETVIGMKGLPGRAGLGIGHRPSGRHPWKNDADLHKLKELIGDDSAEYGAMNG